MNRQLFLIGIGVFILQKMYAQSDADALRISQQNVLGSAREIGLSGAFGGLGADYSSATINPAGIGLYRTSEFSFTSALSFATEKSSFLDNSLSAQQSRFIVPNFAMVFSTDLKKKKKHHSDNNSGKWNFFNVGFGANRINNFNRQLVYSGFNTQNSLTDYYLEELNPGFGTNPSDIANKFPFTASMGYNAYIINPNSTQDSTHYFSLVTDGSIQQQRTILEKGNITEYSLSFAGNYNDHLYIGLTLGLPNVNYNSTSIYTESDVNDVHPYFNNFQLTDYYSTTGIGVDARLGVVYRVNDWLRLGGAVHTPIYYWLNDQYYSSITSDLEQFGSYNYTSPNGSYNYDFSSPWRFTGSASLFFKKYGFIDADYELTDYSSMQYHFNSAATADDLNFENQLNQTINAKYGITHTVRVGAELALGPIRLRAGGSYETSPFQNGVATGTSDYHQWNASGGIGVRGENFYFDAGFQHNFQPTFYQPYTLSSQDVPGASIQQMTNVVAITLGYHFK